MAEFVYNVAKKRFIDGSLDLDTGGSDTRWLLLETDAEDADHANLAAIISAGAVELTSTGYARVAATSEATSQDDTNDRAEADQADVVFPSVAQAGSEVVVAAILYLHVDGTNANDVPIAHYDTNFPITPQGGDITLTIDATGALRIA